MPQYLIIEGTTVVGVINLDPGDSYDPGEGRSLIPLEPTTAEVIQNNYAATTNPTVNDDSTMGYAVGSFWVNTTTKKAWQCSSASVGAAIWNRITVPLGNKIITVDLTDPNADYSTIAGAVAVATSGDIILISAGTHSQSSTLTINVSCTLRGQGVLRTTIARTILSSALVESTVKVGTSSVSVTFEDLLIQAEWRGSSGTAAALHLDGNGSARMTRARAYVFDDQSSGGGIMSACYMQDTGAKSLTMDDSTLGSLDVFTVTTCRTLWVAMGNFYFTRVEISGSGVCAYINNSGTNATLEDFTCGTFTINAANSIQCYGKVSMVTINDAGNVLSVGRWYKTTTQELWFKGLTADPTYVRDGMTWHRSDLGRLYARLSSATRLLPPASDTAPANVTKATASAGSATEAARQDHKHDVTTAAPATGIGGGNSEGDATSLARSNHDHKLRETGGPTDLTIAAVADGRFVKRSGTTLVGSIVYDRLELGVSSGAVITTGAKGRKATTVAGTIVGWRLVSDVSTTCVLDVWKANDSIPTNANSITASAKPSLTAAQLNSSTTLTGWTTAVAVGDVFILEVESNNNAKYLYLELAIQVS